MKPFFPYIICICLVCACSQNSSRKDGQTVYESIGPLEILKPVPDSTEIKPGLKGYNIPMVDLNHRSEMHVVIDRDKNQYLGHPTTLLLDDGKTMIVVYPKGHGKGSIVMKRSLDGGLTWSERLPTPPTWETSKEVPTLYETTDPTGKKRLILFSGLYPARRAISDDQGETWGELESMGDWGGVVVMADMIRLKDDNYMALFHDDGRFIQDERKRTGIRTIYKTISGDGGLTWSKPEGIITRKDVGPCEPGLVRSPDGNQIAMLIRENLRVANSLIIFSDDEGETWTKPVELPSTLTGDRHQAVYTGDGRLLISFRDHSPKTEPDSPTEGDWVAWVGSYENLQTGHPGQYRIRIKDNTKGYDCAYPAVELLPDGTIMATTYGHWDEGEEPYILGVRFKMTDIDSLATKKENK
ncbi:MAG TPA: exo-alpha-sialidase [Bacteroides sp.]|nr:exo-alpha-sialidase [Bacteroides sp.]